MDKKSNNLGNMRAFNAKYSSGLQELTNPKESWIMDSGASVHMCYRRDFFSIFQEIQEQMVTFGNDRILSVKGKDTIKIKKIINDEWYESIINEVLHSN